MAHMKEFEHLKIKLEDIKKSTNNFSHRNFIGEGGFGQVYTGEIAHSKGQTIVAFKRLNRVFGQGDPEFWKEIMTLSFYKHENIVSLLGYCDDSHENILVYEYASRKSLDQYLHHDNLTWVQRLKICIGAARGLAHLHNPLDTQLRLLHRDIKSSNILLDENWNAKISDFGLSKFGPANKLFTYLISNAVGTPGYCDPLYMESGLLTKESDVYSFGVVLFEVLCGRLCIRHKNDTQPLIEMVREYMEKNKISELIYGKIENAINPNALKVFVKIAYQCLERERRERPSMTQIVEALENALKIQCPEPVPTPYSPAGILYVKVLRITGIEENIYDPFAAFNAYVILELKSKQYVLPYMKKSTVKYSEVNHEWNEEFTLYVHDLRSQDLNIHIYDVVSAEKHEYVGRASKMLKYLKYLDFATPQLFIFEIKRVGYRKIGKLMVEMVYMPFGCDELLPDIKDVIMGPIQMPPVGTPRGGGLLVVIIHNGLLCDESDHTHASVSLLLNGESRNTLIMMNTRDPRWEQEFTFMLKDPPTNEELHLEVFNNSWMGRTLIKKSSGCVDISLEDVVNEKQTINQYTLLRPSVSFNFLYVELHWRPSY